MNWLHGAWEHGIWRIDKRPSRVHALAHWRSNGTPARTTDAPHTTRLLCSLLSAHPNTLLASCRSQLLLIVSCLTVVVLFRASVGARDGRLPQHAVNTVEHEHHNHHEQPPVQHPTPIQRRQPSRRTIQRTRSSLSLDHPESLSSSTSRRTKRLQKPRAARYEEFAKQQEAEWYLSLPDKVKRQHFSREEQRLLSSRCDSLLQNQPSPVDVVEGPSTLPPQLHLQLPPPQQSLLEEEHHQVTAESKPLDETSSTYSRPQTASSTSSSTVVVDPAAVQRATSVRYFRPQDMASCFDPSYAKRPRGHASNRRTLSLSGASMRHSTSSIPSLLPSPIPPFSAGHRRNFSATPRKSESSSTFDPNAVHYKDPQTRAKLRAYLGSPQKFDEAVEFGFPSHHQEGPYQYPDTHLGADPAAASALELPSDFLAPLTLSHDLQSFMNDDWLPFLESDEEADHRNHARRADTVPEDPIHDDSSVPDLPSPVTPGDHEEIYHRAQRMALMSSSSSAARHATQLGGMHSAIKPQPSFLNSYTNGGFGMREMTLRLTLTRPDLRAHEEELYGWQGKPRDDPLALEELPVSDDTNGEMGPFGAGGAGKAGRRESKSLKRYFTIRKDRKILGYAVG